VIPTKVFEKTRLAFFAPIRPYLNDPSVSESMINGSDQIYVERRGVLALVDARFESKEALTAAGRNLSQYVGKPVSAARPILEGRVPGGSRVEAILSPVAPDGPHVSIRLFFKEMLTVKRLVEFDSLTDDAAEAMPRVRAQSRSGTSSARRCACVPTASWSAKFAAARRSTSSRP